MLRRTTRRDRRRSTEVLDQVQPTGPDAPLLRLEWRALWRAWQRETFAFWAVCAYFFVEYVRPQQVWRVIDVLPFGKVTLAAALLAYMLEGLKSRRMTHVDALLAAFTGIIVLSSFTAFRPAWAFDDWSLFLNWLIMYFLVTHLVTTPRRMLLFWGLFMLWSLKMSQHGARTFIIRGGAFADWGATGGPGWFHNSGEFAIQMCIFLPMALHVVLGLRHQVPRWKTWALVALLPGTAFLSLVASSSRGGQIGMVAVLLFMIAQSKHRVRGLLSAVVVLAGLWLVMPPEQKERFETMGDDQTSQSRLTYWEDGIEIMNQHPVLGIGYNNWIPYYHRYYNAAGELPHNIFIEAGSELGYAGLAGFLALIAATFVTNYRTRKLALAIPDWGPMLRNMAYGLDGALVGFMASGFFVTVLYYPFFWVNLAFTAALAETTRRAAQRARAARSRPVPEPVATPSEQSGAAARVAQPTSWVTG